VRIARAEETLEGRKTRRGSTGVRINSTAGGTDSRGEQGREVESMVPRDAFGTAGHAGRGESRARNNDKTAPSD